MNIEEWEGERDEGAEIKGELRRRGRIEEGRESNTYVNKDERKRRKGFRSRRKGRNT